MHSLVGTFKYWQAYKLCDTRLHVGKRRTGAGENESKFFFFTFILKIWKKYLKFKNHNFCCRKAEEGEKELSHGQLSKKHC